MPTNGKTLRRNRVHYAFLILATMLLGLASRKFGADLPAFVAAYSGDMFWALLVFWLVGFLFVRRPSYWVANIAIGFAFSIELSQLYHAGWLDQLRITTLGALILGQGFLWSDLVCYAAGIFFGYGVENALKVQCKENLHTLV